MIEERTPPNKDGTSKNLEKDEDMNSEEPYEKIPEEGDITEEVDREDDISEEKASDETDVEIMDMSGDASKYADIDFDDDEQLKDMLKDFSDIEDLSIEEMMEIQGAIDDVMDLTDESEPISNVERPLDEVSEFFEDPYEGWGIYDEIKPEFKPEITDDLESLIQEELEKKRVKKKVVTEEEFKQYCLERNSKIWYHALWTLVFDLEDHQAQKETLYELLKEVTSKSAIDPMPEHKFYFGLGFILRLSLNGKKIIDFRGEKLKLNVGIDVLNDILHEVGPPVSLRPIITKSERKKMFTDFLTDDFKDI
ncbi:MAG: hypothetical protein EU530_07105 [Promethearchaeota archaeon]|nr:MAG: hypothetical protein EU530_07105 [Candidatus Lokiarchaeota archaeon]